MCCFYLFLDDQNPFPYLEAKIKAGDGVITSAVFKGDNHRLYFFVKEDEIIYFDFEKQLFWTGGGTVRFARTDTVTSGNYADRFCIGDEDYTVVYGTVNSETVFSIEIHMANGEVLPVVPDQDGFFLVQLLWNSAVELCAYDKAGNLLYQDYISGDDPWLYESWNE